jgi:hypothetical protein
VSKPGNGQAKSGTYLLAFDLQDEAEWRAWSVTQSLAAERKLKRTLLGFLLALDEVRRQTSKDYGVEEMMARFVASLVVDGSASRASTPISRVGDFAEDAPLIIGTANHADPNEAREQLALSMGNLFDDD